jgi:hypothetical protein
VQVDESEIERSLRDPTPLEVLAMVEDSWKNGRANSLVQFVIPARGRRIRKHIQVWDRVTARVVRRILSLVTNADGSEAFKEISGFLVEVHASDVIEACRREKMRIHQQVATPMVVNKLKPRARISTRR